MITKINNITQMVLRTIRKIIRSRITVNSNVSISTELNRISKLEMDFLEVLLNNQDQIEITEKYRWDIKTFFNLKDIEDMNKKYKKYDLVTINEKRINRLKQTFYRVKLNDTVFHMVKNHDNEASILQPNDIEMNLPIKNNFDKDGNYTGKVISTANYCCVLFDVIEELWLARQMPNQFEAYNQYRVRSVKNKRFLINQLSGHETFAWSLDQESAQI